ncbi:hypothetical protein DTO166G4_1196 [Paecilomyces variotii]|nr:hypothetical protein DTO166G4_1196 [Paecilomyces variotii]KAJ9242195.1 hypothetical protein DTO166G5_598 [Paecilomyces variotii]KAJ9256974.1 hypothetical protein DTO195F2_5653 [Paecilomyces variotii]KAJ9305789.1 hypothetical protein DTO217A2_4702 [Paecilomyces variotii]KAJ9351367.1 hypothetical protein DTO027B9_6404 [Paecilomyces variotii]
MYSVIRPTLSATRNSVSKSSLRPGDLLQGAHWDYRLIDAVKGDNTHTSTVFKAKVIPHKDGANNPLWAIIKAAPPGNATARENLDRERSTYHLPGVASAVCFRKMYDAMIDDGTDGSVTYIALEWLDTTLAEVKYQPDSLTYALIKTVLKATLTSCVVLEDQKRVNTDYKPANILLSDVKTGRVTAKVGDLGLVFPTGHRLNAQPYAMRAPEVFLGQPCTAPSQVWAVAAMLLCWINPGVLGAWDSPHPLINEAWCMAKIKRLFPEWNIPTPNEVERITLKNAVQSARRITEEEPVMQAILPFEKETQKVKMPEQLRELLLLMLVVNPSERPSASYVLASREFKNLMLWNTPQPQQ